MFVENVKRYVLGFPMTSNENGHSLLEISYELKPIKLSILQTIFKINPNEQDPIVRDLIDCYSINEKQANELQPYVIGEVMDLNKYNWFIDASDESTCKHSEEYLNAKAESEKADT